MPYSSASPTLKIRPAVKIACQAEDRVIGGINCFLLRVETEDWRKRPKSLFSRAQHGRVGICQDCGSKETLTDSVSAHNHAPAFGDRILDINLVGNANLSETANSQN